MKSTFITTDQYMLEDQHVLLMPMDEGDYHNLLPFSLHEPELWKYHLSNSSIFKAPLAVSKIEPTPP